MKRLTIFAHYDVHGLVDPHVRYYVRSLSTICDDLVFVTAAGSSMEYLESLNLPLSTAISRNNVGLDFGSWKAGLTSVDLSKYDELILCNDSVYGPIFPLKDAFFSMRYKTCDFWGMTASREITPHLQSYFLVFRRSALRSRAFGDFWSHVELLPDKHEIIRRYEVGLTEHLNKAGLKGRSYFRARYRSARYWPALRETYWYFLRFPEQKRHVVAKFRERLLPNPMHFFWRELLAQRVPFLKVELLRNNPKGIDIRGVIDHIANVSDYPTHLITEHLARVAPASSR